MMKKLITLLCLIGTFASQAQINVYLTVEAPSDQSTCDGWVMAYVQQGQAPYTYIWNDTDTSYGDQFFPEYDTLLNLCSGVYTLDIYDANNDSLHLDFFLSVNDLTFGGGTGAADTLEFWVEDCSFDYSIPIDTAYLDSTSRINVIPFASADSIHMIWNIVQQSDTIVVEDTLTGYFPIGADVVIDAAIYCPDSAMKAQVTVVRVLGLLEHDVAVQETQLHHIEVFPNPIKDFVTIRGMNNESGEVKLFNMNGALVHSINVNALGNDFRVNLNDLPSGMYILRYTGETEVSSVRITKQ